MTDEYRLQLYAPELLKALESPDRGDPRNCRCMGQHGSPPRGRRGSHAALERQSESARAVIDSWENGDLAGAVRDLEDSLTVALKAIADARGGAA